MRRFFLFKLCSIALILCCNITLGKDSTQTNTQNATYSLDSDSLTSEAESATKNTKAKKLDYANLFTKPDIDWNNIASEKSGFFVGLGVLGAMLQSNDYLANNLRNVFGAQYPFGVGFHTKFGYAHYSTPYIGFRIYGEYSRVFSTDSFTASIESNTPNTKPRQYTLDSYNVGINVIFDTNLGRNYIHSLGIIIDLSYLIGIDFASHWTRQANGIESFGVDRFLSGNKFALGLGVGYVYNSKHRFELLFRRFTDIRQSQETFISASDAPMVFNQMLMMSIGYMYVF